MAKKKNKGKSKRGSKKKKGTAAKAKKRSNVIPLPILVRRQHKLTKIVKERGGKVAA